MQAARCALKLEAAIAGRVEIIGLSGGAGDEICFGFVERVYEIGKPNGFVFVLRREGRDVVEEDGVVTSR